ncbi:MAG: hypothetical protein HC892_11900 [Saprospiraceae bacterium]|nr:hypothetical protein [Saprospiraceae bacterium]
MLKPIEGQVRVREISMIYLANEVRRKLLQKIVEVALENIPQTMLDAHGKELVETNVVV